jgi:hypothetical protein
LFSASPCRAGIYICLVQSKSSITESRRRQAVKHLARETANTSLCLYLFLCPTITLVEWHLLRLQPRRDCSTNSNFGLLNLLRSLSRFAERNSTCESFIWPVKGGNCKTDPCACENEKIWGRERRGGGGRREGLKAKSPEVPFIWETVFPPSWQFTRIRNALISYGRFFIRAFVSSLSNG